MRTCFVVYIYRGVDEREEHAECECPQDGPAHDPEYSQGGLHKNTFMNVVFGTKPLFFPFCFYFHIYLHVIIQLWKKYSLCKKSSEYLKNRKIRDVILI